MTLGVKLKYNWLEVTTFSEWLINMIAVIVILSCQQLQSLANITIIAMKIIYYL